MGTLRIEHTTRYDYARPVAFGRHRLVLRPREGHDLRVERMELTIAPAHKLAWSRDVFGNSVAFVEFLEKSNVLEVHSDVVVHRFGDVEGPGAVVPYPASYDPLESAIVAAYLEPTYPEDQPLVRQWLDERRGHWPFDDAEGAVLALGAAVHEELAYERRDDPGVRSPAKSLELMSGSCRDLATLMMEAGRALGLATRFASGYLDCPASIAGHAAMHAWVETYLPGRGWIGFDPTLGEPTSLKHVVAGVSQHPRGSMPVSGTWHGPAGEYLGLSVQVRTTRGDQE